MNTRQIKVWLPLSTIVCPINLKLIQQINLSSLSETLCYLISHLFFYTNLKIVMWKMARPNLYNQYINFQNTTFYQILANLNFTIK